MTSTRTIKIWILVVTAVFGIFSAVTISVGIWSSTQLGAYTAISPSVRYAVEYFLACTIAAGCIIMVFILFFVCVCGCWEEPNDSRFKFTCVLVVLLGILGLQISGAALGYINRDKIKEDTLADDVVKAIRRLYGIETEPSSAIDALQENGECCGWYNYTDWRDSRYAREVTVLNDSVVPDSCCVKGPKERFHCGRHFSVYNIYTKGCQGVFLYKLIRDKLYPVAVVATIAVVIQVLVMGLLALLICRKTPESPGRDDEQELICRSGFCRELFDD